MPLIEQAISELKPEDDPAVLRELTALYYSDAIGVLVKRAHLGFESRQLVETWSRADART